MPNEDAVLQPDPADLAEALANQRGTGARYRGNYRRRRNPQTGQVEEEVWVQGQGYLPRGTIAALPTEDRRDIDSARNMLATASRNAQYAEQFARYNRQAPVDTGNPILNVASRLTGNTGGETGGTTGLPVPNFLMNPTRRNMERLTSSMVRANIQPGQAGTMNSMFEQILARQMYPTTDSPGTANDDAVVQMMVDREEMLAALRAAEEWGARRRSLTGFDVDWYTNHQARVRREAEARVRERLGLTNRGGARGENEITIDAASGRRIR